MNELAYWIIDVGNGLLVGAAIGCVLILAIRILEELPDNFRVPFFSPLWEKMMAVIHGALRR